VVVRRRLTPPRQDERQGHGLCIEDLQAWDRREWAARSGPSRAQKHAPLTHDGYYNRSYDS
jgi:hypothetical protein